MGRGGAIVYLAIIHLHWIKPEGQLLEILPLSAPFVASLLVEDLTEFRESAMQRGVLFELVAADFRPDAAPSTENPVCLWVAVRTKHLEPEMHC